MVSIAKAIDDCHCSMLELPSSQQADVAVRAQVYSNAYEETKIDEKTNITPSGKGRERGKNNYTKDRTWPLAQSFRTTQV